ncbi:MAG: response regulator [Chloroflexota bacterium]
MKPKIILLVEDNPSDIALTQRALAKSHVANALVVAEDGQEALDYLFAKGKYTDRDANNFPALVLLDLKLPYIDGLEVLRQIRNDPRTCRLPVVILTTSKEEQDVSQSYDLGANSYIRKPVDFTQFAKAIEHLGLYWLVLNEPAPLPKGTGTASSKEI